MVAMLNLSRAGTRGGGEEIKRDVGIAWPVGRSQIAMSAGIAWTGQEMEENLLCVRNVSPGNVNM